MADKVINNIKLPNGEIYSVGGAGRFGIKGDYSTHYGIEYCQHGLIENPVGTTDIVVKGGMMLCLPGAETKTTIGSDITYSVSSLTNVTIFYAEGNMLEAGEVHYSVNEPSDNGIENYIAWWNPDVGKWQFKSNDTGNVWREAIATPIADIRIKEGNIVRIDYIGYRLLNDDIYGLKSETANVDLSNLTEEGINFIIKNSAGASLFDTKLVDHILTYEQSKGWALQGTYVYKEAVAGSRYGYPDFYNKCVEEFENSEINGIPWEQPLLTSNTDYGFVSSSAIFGDAYPYKAFNGKKTSGDKYLSNSTSSGNITWQLPKSIKMISCKVYTTDESSLLNRYPKTITILGSNNGSEWDELVVKSGYTQPTLGAYVEVTIDNPNFYTYYKWDFGVNFGGDTGVAVAEIEINAYNTISQYIYKNPNGHLFYDIADKSQIDELYNTNGIAWYYGIDKENERIFLPRAKHFAFTGGVMGNGMTLGLTNGTNNASPYTSGNTNVLILASNLYGESLPQTNAGATGLTDNLAYGITTDPTKSGITLETDDSKYLYICVGNTNVESAVTDVVDVTTTENDTIPLFTGMYFDFTPNNVSWLRGGEQANSGGIYTFTYNELVNILNGETKYGDLKVIDVADMVTGEDYSEYWKVNQEDMTFITPTAISNKALSGEVMGNGMALGLTNGIKNGGFVSADINGAGLARPIVQAYGSDAGVTIEPSYTDFDRKKAIGITTDPTKSGIIAEQSTSQLYFKVANAVQNLELLDAGEVLESLAGKISRQDCKAYITETYKNGSSWYRVYSDGWCEQGGEVVGVPAGANSGAIALLKSYTDTNYSVQITYNSTSTGAVGGGPSAANLKTTSSFALGTQGGNYAWEAKGYIS